MWFIYNRSATITGGGGPIIYMFKNLKYFLYFFFKYHQVICISGNTKPLVYVWFLIVFVGQNEMIVLSWKWQTLSSQYRRCWYRLNLLIVKVTLKFKSKCISKSNYWNLRQILIKLSPFNEWDIENIKCLPLHIFKLLKEYQFLP